MNQDEIIYRLDLLYTALQFSTQEKAMFTVGERIMINQERGALLYCLTCSNTPLHPVSDVIEQKIKETQRLISVYNWIPLNNTDFDNEY